MPDLKQSLHGQDIGHIRNTASLWGLELSAPDIGDAITQLATAMQDRAQMEEMIESLTPEAYTALAALLRAGGKLPWAAFIRLAGELRVSGAGRRDRQQMFLHPTSANEMLYYRALIARAFFDTPKGVQEFAYIPDDMLPVLRMTRLMEDTQTSQTYPTAKQEALGRPATTPECRHPLPATDHLLDEAVTLLAALRMGNELPLLDPPIDVLAVFMRQAMLLAGSDPVPEMVKSFLEMPRKDAMALLGEAWEKGEQYSELRHLEGLLCEGEWQEDVLQTRRLLLGYLEDIPEGKWWSLTAFIYALKEKHPDFQRPAGDYDSWFIKRIKDGNYLRGYESWEEVDGALVRHLITGPLYWLGRADLAATEPDGEITAFRRRVTLPESKEDGKITIVSNGRLTVSKRVPRLVRYQVARFCEWEDSKPDECRYRLTVASLRQAITQDLKVSQLLPLLAKNASGGIPPALVRALKRWERNGSEARLETQLILQTTRPEVLEELRKSKAGRFLGEVLSPTAVLVKPGAKGRVLSALAELGLLAELDRSKEEDT